MLAAFRYAVSGHRLAGTAGGSTVGSARRAARVGRPPALRRVRPPDLRGARRPMTQTGNDTTVVIVGGGVAGLALGTFLAGKGVDCVVLVKNSREYVEQRQRAGSLDAYGVRVLDEWGVG